MRTLFYRKLKSETRLQKIIEGDITNAGRNVLLVPIPAHVPDGFARGIEFGLYQLQAVAVTVAHRSASRRSFASLIKFSRFQGCRSGMPESVKTCHFTPATS